MCYIIDKTYIYINFMKKGGFMFKNWVELEKEAEKLRLKDEQRRREWERRNNADNEERLEKVLGKELKKYELETAKAENAAKKRNAKEAETAFKKLSPEERKRRQYASYRKWILKNPGRSREYSRRWREANPEYAKRFYSSVRRWILKSKYGLTPERVDEMDREQQNRCGICGIVMGLGHGRHIDHNHETGKVRKLLCCNCNRGLGCFKDSPKLLRLARNYLLKHRQK
jgi:hypothetical protein